MAFETIQHTFKALYNRVTKGSWTPRSGQKRRRDEEDSAENQPQSKAQASLPVQADVDLPKHPTPPAWPSIQEAVRGHKIDATLGAASTPAASSNASVTFSMAGRLRELAPRVSEGGNTHANLTPPSQQGADQAGQQAQTGQGPIEAVNPAKQPGPAIGNHLGAAQKTFDANIANVWRPAPVEHVPYQPLPTAHVHQQPLPQQQPQRAGGRAAPPPPPPAFDTPLSTPGLRQPQGLPSFVGQAATPRQLFGTPEATPESTRNMLGGLQLGSTRRPRPAAPAAGGPVLGFPAGLSVGSYPAAVAPQPGSALYRQMASLQPHQQPQQPLQPPLQPYRVATAGHRFLAMMTGGFLGEELKRPAPTRQLTSEELRAMVAREEARQAERRRQAPLAPLREDGGYIAGDTEEADSRVAAVAQEARATTERLREKLDRVRQAASAAADPRVVAAASGAVAARASLAVSQAVAGPETVTGIERKVAAHEREVQRMRREAEESTRAQVEAVKAAVESQRAQVKPQPPQPPAAPAPAPAPQQRAALPAAGRKAAAAAPPTRRPAPAGRAGPSRPAAAAAADDDVVNLVSSDDEEEEEQQQQWQQQHAPAVGAHRGEDSGGPEVISSDEEEEVQQGESEEGEGEQEDDEYGGEYGTYGDERYGGGNPALRLATRAERATWRRTMDPAAPPEEVLLAFRPNPATDMKLSREKLQCMEVATWLNDEAINLYMLLLQARDTRLRQRAGGGRPGPRCHFFNSFFYNKLFQDEGAYNYNNVRRWTNPARLKNNLQASPGVLELDRVLIPIHKGVHWTCALVDLREKAVRYYDSLKGEDHALVRHLLTWVADESADKLQQRWDTSKWRVEFPKSIPAQTNGCDCGVFTIMFADRLGAGAPLDFSQADMGLLRIKVLHRLVAMRVEE